MQCSSRSRRKVERHDGALRFVSTEHCKTARTRGTTKGSDETIFVSSFPRKARTGVAIRGHSHEESNFVQLLQLRAEDDPCLAEWMKRTKPLTHSDIQNEMLSLMSNELLRALIEKIKASKFGYFSVIFDGTTDVNRREQLTICARKFERQFSGYRSVPRTL